MGQYYHIVNLSRREFLNPHRLGDGLKLMEFASSSYGTMSALAMLIGSPVSMSFRDSENHNAAYKSLWASFVGRWEGQRIVVAGDYANNGSFLSRRAKANLKKQGAEIPTLYSFACEHFRDISREMLPIMASNRGARISLARRFSFGETAADNALIHRFFPSFEDQFKEGQKQNSLRNFEYKLPPVSEISSLYTHFIVNHTKKQCISAYAFGENNFEKLTFSRYGSLTALALLLSDGNGRGGGDFRAETETAEEKAALYDKYIGSWAGDRIEIGNFLTCRGYTDVTADVIKFMRLESWLAEQMDKKNAEMQASLVK